MACNGKSLIKKDHCSLNITKLNMRIYHLMVVLKSFPMFGSKPSIECHVPPKLTFKWLRHILTIYVLVFQMNIKFHIYFLGNKSWLCYIPLQDHFNEPIVIWFGKYSFPNIDPKIQNFVGILIFKLGMQLENISLFRNTLIFIWTSVCSSPCLKPKAKLVAFLKFTISPFL